MVPLPLTWKAPVPALKVRSLLETEPVVATVNAELLVDMLTAELPAADTVPVTASVPALVKSKVPLLPAEPSIKDTLRSEERRAGKEGSKESVLLALVMTVAAPPMAPVVAVRVTLALLIEFLPKL